MRCGRIEDAQVEPIQDSLVDLENSMGNLTKHGIFGHRLEFIGLCSECRGMEDEYFCEMTETQHEKGDKSHES
jgi:hypothetical protein